MRGLEKNLVILDRMAYNRNQEYIKELIIVSVLGFGNGWVDVRMNTGPAVRRIGGTISWRYNNPGNIKFGAYARSSGAVGRGWGGHAVYPTYEIGKIAKKNLLFTPIRKYYNLSLSKALSYYAPVNDPHARNRPDLYARFIMNRTPGVTLDTILREFSPLQQNQMLTAMEQFEGFKEGTTQKL